MAAGRPAVFVGPEHCETADTIRHVGCGMTIAPGDDEGLVASLTRLAADPTLARRMGERGRSAFLANYEKTLCCNLWRELIARSVSVGRRSAVRKPLRTVWRSPGDPARTEGPARRRDAGATREVRSTPTLA